MRSILTSALMFTAFVLLMAPGRDSHAAAPTDKQYTATVAPLQLKVGATGTATLTIKPNKGLHFNEEFPAKFTVAPTAFVKCPKDKLTGKTGEVKVAGGIGTVAIPLTGLAAGAGSVQVTGNFSVCSDEQCYMLRGEILTLQVTVQ